MAGHTTSWGHLSQVNTPLIDIRDLGQACDELNARINDELESGYFFKLDHDKKRCYEAQNLFGLTVYNAFPSSRYDIQEAGSCFACGRWTACVFHLMRALETPLRLLAAELGVGFEFGNWNTVLNQFDKKLKEVIQQNSATKGPDRRENEEFYSETSALLRSVKNAWRNRVSHAEKSYDGERARGVLNSAESIMKHLAGRLRDESPVGAAGPDRIASMAKRPPRQPKKKLPKREPDRVTKTKT